MAGHSKWANIKHRKGRQDAARGKTFGKIIREITVAARMGGGRGRQSPTSPRDRQGARGQHAERHRSARDRQGHR